MCRLSSAVGMVKAGRPHACENAGSTFASHSSASHNRPCQTRLADGVLRLASPCVGWFKNTWLLEGQHPHIGLAPALLAYSEEPSWSTCLSAVTSTLLPHDKPRIFSVSRFQSCDQFAWCMLNISSVAGHVLVDGSDVIGALCQTCVFSHFIQRHSLGLKDLRLHTSLRLSAASTRSRAPCFQPP